MAHSADLSGQTSDAARQSALQRVVFVLIEPTHPGNVGACARALRVMGCTELRIVSARPLEYWRDSPQARAMASRAERLLERIRVFEQLDAALADLTLAIAASAAPRQYGAGPIGPRAAADAALAELGESAHRVGFVFGTERTGLSIEQVQRCQLTCRIDAAADYDSLNLSQAVQIVAFCLRERFIGRFGEAEKPPAVMSSTDAAGEPGAAPLYRGFASDAQIEGFYRHLQQALEQSGFLDPAQPRNLMPRLRRLFSRTRLEIEEVDILRGICKALIRLSR